jgi:hypothetical protein
LKALPNVAMVSPNRLVHGSYNVARDANHHNSAGANLKKDAANNFVKGKGVGIAVLDTGQDYPMGSSGRPHKLYFPGGNTSNPTGPGLNGSNLLQVYGTSGYGTDDSAGHGTFCSGCAAANQWPLSDGMAPDAGIVGIKISDNSGTAAYNWLISGWQQAAAVRATYGIRVANNSFSGSPDFNDPVQQTLDSFAYNGNVLVTVASGNNGPNQTASSQSAYNGLACGSINKGSLALSGFSSGGFLTGYGSNRTYPDIAAVGASVNGPLPNSESSYSVASGTSFSSPMVAGMAALVLQAGGAPMKAIEAKAVLLNYTNNESAESGSVNTSYRNQKGCGIARADYAVDAALAGDFQRATLSNAQKVRNFTFAATQSQRKSITIAWMRSSSNLSFLPNLDLRIYDPSSALVASDLMVSNSYAKCSFVPAASGQYRAEVTWVALNPTFTVEFAISGVGKLVTGPPTLTGINPASVLTYSPTLQQVTLTGTNLDTITQLNVGSQAVSFTSATPTQVQFFMPTPFEITTHNVTVTNPAGASAPVQLQVQGVHPGVITGSAYAARGYAAPYKLWGDRAWAVVLLVSTSNVPSVVPGTINLGIGNVFTDLAEVGVIMLGTNGESDLSLPYPAFLPSFFPLYFQGVTLDPALPFTIPFEVTNVHTVTVI